MAAGRRERLALNILSIQSWVAYGHVGNAAALFPLQRLGAEVWAINTVQFSNHPGYGTWRGEVFPGEATGALVDGIAALDALARCDAVLSGYLGNHGSGLAVLNAVANVRAVNPSALYCCDPVLGDDRAGLYVRPGLPELVRDRLLPAADIATPNRFELEWLTGIACTTAQAAKAALHRLASRMTCGGPRSVLATGLRLEETPPDHVDMLVGEGGQYHLLRTPLLPLDVNGAGDVLAALFLLHRLAGGDAPTAMARAASSLFGILRRTAELGSHELALIAAQEELVTPSTRFAPVAC